MSTYGREVVTQPLNLEPMEAVRPTNERPVCRLDDEGRWVVENKRWGLVPFFRSGKPLKDTEKGKGDGWKMSCFNSRVETCSSAPTFREAFKRRRCVVPASAWVEWTGEPGAKTLHRFCRADDELIWFAGLYDRCSTSDEGDIDSFTILTGPSAGMLADYHNRAPVILNEDEIEQWIDLNRDPADLIAAVRPERFVVA